MWAGALPSSPALQGWAHPRPSSGPGTVAQKRVRAAAVGPPESVHKFLRSLASPHWAPRGCYLVRHQVLSQVLPRHQRRRKPASPSSWSPSASPGSSSFLSPPPGPREGFWALLQAPQPWASESVETLCSQASVGGGKRVWLRNGHMGGSVDHGLRAHLHTSTCPPPGF